MFVVTYSLNKTEKLRLAFFIHEWYLKHFTKHCFPQIKVLTNLQKAFASRNQQKSRKKRFKVFYLPLHCPIIIPKNIVGSWKFLDTPRLPHTHIYTHIHTHIHTHITRTHSQSNDNKSWNKVILCWHFCLPCSQFLSVLFSLYFYANDFRCLSFFISSLFFVVSECVCL